MPDASTQTRRGKKIQLIVKETHDEEEELKCLGFRPQSRIGECEGCKAVCEECENLMIVEEEDEDDLPEVDYLECRGCGMFARKKDIEDDTNDGFGTCGECEVVSEDEDVCCECKTDEDVEQCMECDKYLCIECDPNEMATYGEGHSCSTMCAPCGEAYEKQLKKEDVEYWNKVDYFVTCDICGRDWDKKHDHRLVGALCHSWAYQTRSFCCPSCIDDGKCECDDCGEPSDSEEE